MFKKFKDGDLYVNRIKAHPKVEFMLSSGSVANSLYTHNRKYQTLASITPSGFEVQTIYGVASSIPNGSVGMFGALPVVSEDVIYDPFDSPSGSFAEAFVGDNVEWDGVELFAEPYDFSSPTGSFEEQFESDWL